MRTVGRKIGGRDEQEREKAVEGDIWQREKDEDFLAAKRSRAAAGGGGGGGGINRPKGKLFERGVAGRYVRARERTYVHVYVHICVCGFI